MPDNFTKFIASSRCSKERESLFREMIETLEDCSDFLLGLKADDSRGNPALFTEVQTVLAKAEMAQGQMK